MLIEVEHTVTRNFTIVPNDTARDTRLTFRARGLLAHLLSLPSGASTSAEKLAEENPEGRDAIRASLKELRDHGYVELVRSRDDNGNFSSNHVVHDVPTGVFPGRTDDWKSAVGEPAAVNPPVIDKDLRKDQYPPNPPEGGTGPVVEPGKLIDVDNAREVVAAATASATAKAKPKPEAKTRRRKKNIAQALNEGQQADFEEWWQRYPRKKRRADSILAWAKALEAGITPEQLTIALDNYLISVQDWEEQHDAEFTWYFAAPRFIDETYIDFLDGPDSDRWVAPGGFSDPASEGAPMQGLWG